MKNPQLANKALSLYEKDFYLWTQKTAEFLSQRQFNQVDWESLIEEIEALGRNQKKEIQSRLIVLLWHLLKWKYQPEKRTNSWKMTIINQRDEIELELEDSPSLRNLILKVFDKCYQKARKRAATETGLPLKTFPETCPFTSSQVLEEDWLPREEEND